VQNQQNENHISREELKTLVHESGSMIPRTHQDMLISILDLEKVTVNDIMVPKNEIIGLDFDDPIDELIEQAKNSQHTRLPVFKGDVNNIIGVLHLRNMTKVLSSNEVNKSALLQVCREPYFIPESTPLNHQLLQFQQEKRRTGIVVDEYGDVQGLATMEDILEEIVGEFTTDYSTSSGSDITVQKDKSVLIDGSATIRSVNKALKWALPTEGPKTINGLIIEHLEFIPEQPLCIKVEEYQLEVRQVKDNMIKTIRAVKV